MDYAGRVDPYDLRVAAAEFRLVLNVLEAAAARCRDSLALPGEVLVRAGVCTFALAPLSDGYALVLVLPRHAFFVSRRALAQSADELEREAGLFRLGVKRERLRWSKVDVRPLAGDTRRPEAVWHDAAWRSVVVLGRLPDKDLEPLETGFLARLASGREILLVREPLGKWFAGDPL